MYAQRKQPELGSILNNFFCNFEYLGLQKRLNIFGGEIFRGFEEKTRFHQVRECMEFLQQIVSLFFSDFRESIFVPFFSIFWATLVSSFEKSGENGRSKTMKNLPKILSWTLSIFVLVEQSVQCFKRLGEKVKQTEEVHTRLENGKNYFF